MATMHLIKRAMTVAALAFFWTGQAQANTVTLNLTGTVSGVSTSSWSDASNNYDRWYWDLDGLSALNAITVNQGDTIDATITLDSSYTIPTPGSFTWFILGASGPLFPAGDTYTTADTSYFNSGAAGPVDTGRQCSTSGQFSACGLSFPPTDTPITFDTIHSVFTLDSTSGLNTAVWGTASLDHAYMYFTNFNPTAPVPEPETYAMLMAGLGILGTVARRRKQKAA